MKPFPRMYAERTLTRMYRKLNWTDEQMHTFEPERFYTSNLRNSILSIFLTIPSVHHLF